MGPIGSSAIGELPIAGLPVSAGGITVNAATPGTANGAVTSGSITTVGGPGSLLLIFVQSRSPANTPTDSKSNTWTALSAEQAIAISGTTYYLRVWKCKAGTGGASHTASSSNSGSPSGFETIHFMEFLGSTGLDIDQAVSWNVDTTSTYNSNTVTASVAGLALSFNSILSFSAGSSITHSGDGFTSTASSFMNGVSGPCSEVVYQTSAATTGYQDAVSATSPASDVAFGIFTVGVSSGVTVALTGVTGTGSVGTVAPNASKALTGVTGTGSVGTVTPLLTVALTGVTATGSVGTVIPNSSIALTGVTGTGSPGTVNPNSTIGITGVTGTGSVGNVSAGNDVTVAITGVTATGSVGTLVPAFDKALTGVSGTTSVGTASPVLSLSITGLTATGSAGNIVPASSVSLIGVTGTMSPGTVTASKDVTIALTGVSATGFVGTVTPSGGSGVAGISNGVGLGLNFIRLGGR